MNIDWDSLPDAPAPATPAAPEPINWEALPDAVGTAESYANLAKRGALPEGLWAGDQGLVETPRTLASVVFAGLEKFAQLKGDPEILARVRENRAALQDPSSPLATELAAVPVVKVGDWLADAYQQSRDRYRRKHPVRPEIAESLSGQFVQGLGQAVPTVLQGLTMPATLPAMAAGQIHQEALDDARQKGATDDQARLAAAAYLPAATLDYAADRLFIGRMLKPLVGKVSIGQAVKHLLAQAGTGGGTEAAQQVWLNAVEKAGFKPDQTLTDGVLDSFLVGTFVDGTTTAGGMATSAGTRRLAERADAREAAALARWAESLGVQPPNTLPATETSTASGAETNGDTTSVAGIPLPEKGASRDDQTPPAEVGQPSAGTPARASAPPEIAEILATEKAQIEAQRAEAERRARSAALQQRAMPDLIGEALRPRVADLATKTDLEKHDFWRSMQGLAQTLAGLQTTTTEGQQARRRQLSLEEMREQAGMIFAGAQPELLDAIALKLHGSKPAESVAALRDFYRYAGQQRTPYAAAAQERDAAVAAQRQAEETEARRRQEEMQAAKRRAAQERARIRDTGRDLEGRVVDWTAVPDADLERLAAEPEDAAQVEIAGARAEIERRANEESGTQPLTRDQQIRLLERYGGINPDHPVHRGELATIRESDLGKNRKLWRADGASLDRIAEALRQEVQNGPETEADVLAWLSELAAGRAPKLYERGDLDNEARYAAAAQPDGTTTARFAATRTTEQPLTPQAAKAKEREERRMRRVAPRLFADLDVRIANVEQALRSSGYNGEIPDGVEAAYLPRLRAEKDLIVVGLRSILRGLGLPRMLHESGHAYWRMLTPETRAALQTAYQRDLREQWSPLWKDGELATDVSQQDILEGTQLGLEEWFSELMAALNADWAQRRSLPRIPGWIGDLAAKLRDLVQRLFGAVADHKGLQGDARLRFLTEDFRAFLTRGFSAQRTAAAGAAFARSRMRPRHEIQTDIFRMSVKPDYPDFKTWQEEEAWLHQWDEGAPAVEGYSRPGVKIGGLLYQEFRRRAREENNDQRRHDAQMELRLAQAQAMLGLDTALGIDLPAEIAGLVPNYQDRKLRFQSRLDKALYYVGAPGNTELRARLVASLQEQTGMTEGQIRSLARSVRDRLPAIVRSQPQEGAVRVPEIAPALAEDITGVRWAQSQPLPKTWPETFPRIPVMTTIAALKAHPYYDMAKRGSAAHAFFVASEFFRPDVVRPLVRDPRNTRIAYVHAEEESGRNALPAGLADAIANAGFGRKTDEIVQNVRAGHTGATALERLATPPQFYGPVEPGRDYLLVDDVVTSGSSLNALRAHIEAGGGRVLGAVTYGATMHPQTGYSGDLAPTKETRAAIDNHPEKAEIGRLLQVAGVATNFHALTNSQARYLLRLPLDRIRDSLTAGGRRPRFAAVQGTAGDDAATTGGPAQETGRGTAAPELTAAQIDAYLDRQTIPAEKRAEAAEQIHAVFEGGEADYLPGFDGPHPTDAADGRKQPAAPTVDQRTGRGLEPAEIAELRRRADTLRQPEQPEAIVEALRPTGRVSWLLHEYITGAVPVWDIRGAVITHPRDILALSQAIRSPYFETFKVAFLDHDDRVVHSRILTVGTLSASLVSVGGIMRELQTAAHATNARRLIVAHNHPSGLPEPSSADIQMTRQITAACRAAQIEFVDHVITNGKKYYSFREAGEIGSSETQPTPTPTKLPADLKPPRPQEPGAAQPWEALPVDELAKFDSPPAFGPLVDALRNAYPNTLHLAYLSTRNQLLALERLEVDPDKPDLPALRKSIADGTGREGARGIVAIYPAWKNEENARMSHPAEIALQNTIRDTARALGLNYLDAFGRHWTVNRNSHRMAGFMEQAVQEEAPTPTNARARFEAADAKVREIEAKLAALAEGNSQEDDVEQQGQTLQRELAEARRERNRAQAAATTADSLVTPDPVSQALDQIPTVRALRDEKTKLVQAFAAAKKAGQPTEALLQQRDAINADLESIRRQAEQGTFPLTTEPPVAFGDANPPRADSPPQTAPGATEPAHLRPMRILSWEPYTDAQLTERLAHLRQRRDAIGDDDLEAGRRLTFLADLVRDTREELEARRAALELQAERDAIGEAKPAPTTLAADEDEALAREQAQDAQATLDAEIADAIPDAPEESYPVRDNVDEVGAQVSAATLEPKSGLRRWTEKLGELLRGFRSAVPELPTFKDAARFATFREGLRLLHGLDEVVQREAEEAVADIVAPLQAHSTTEARSKQARLQELRRQAAASPAAKAARAAEIAKLEQEMQGDAWWIFQNVVLYGDLFTRSRLYRRDDGTPIGLPGGLNPAEAEHLFKTWLQRAHAHPQAKAIMEARERHKAYVQRIAEDLKVRGFVFAEGANTNYFPHVMIEQWDGDIAHVKAGTAKDFRGYLITPTGSAKPIETDYLKAMYYHAVQVLAHNKRADILRDYVAREDIKQQLVDEAAKARRRDPDAPPVNWRQIFHTHYADKYALYSPDPDEIPLHPELVIDRDALAHRLGVVLGSGPLQEELKKAGLTHVPLQPAEIQEMLVAGSRELWVLPTEVAEALRGVSRRAQKTDNLVTKILGGTQGLWKRNILFAPWNWLRFEFNNIVSDGEKILVSDPAMASGLLDAGRDVYAFISGSKEASDDVREAFRLGVLDTLTAAEVQALRAQRPFEAFETAKDRNWRVGVNRATSFFASSRWNTMGWSKLREATFRFAKYKADLERMRHGATPRYGGAYWKNVEAMQRVGAPEAIHEQDRTGRLIGRQGPGTGPQASAKPYAIAWEQGGRRFEESYATKEERTKKREALEAQQRQADTELVARKAAAISRATFGDYGELTPNGNWLRRLFIPFYAWTEVNFRYHANLLRNMRDMLATGQIDRKAAASQLAKQTVALGSRAAMGMVLRLALPYLAVGLWNGMQGDDEDDLSEEDRRRFHLILGREDDGKIRVVYLPTAFSDVLKWFSGNRAAALVGDVVAGRTDWQTAAGEFGDGLWRDALNNTFGSAGPVFKIPYTLASGKSTFPDVTDQRTIPSYDMGRVIIGQMTDQFTAEMLELAINKDYVASRDAGEWAQQAILQVRRRDPESWAFYAIKDKAAQFEEAKTGRREQRAAYDAPDAQVLRQFRRAIYQADVPTAVRMYRRLLELGYTAERFESSVRAQDPLYGLPKALRDEFVRGLNPSEREQLRSAYRYYLRMEEMEGAGRRLFPSREASERTRARYQTSPRLDVLHDEIQRALTMQNNKAEANRQADRTLQEAIR